MTWLDRQSFLGKNSDEDLQNARVGIIGLGGGGSHVVQQLAHLGIGKFVIVDPDIITSTNLNRLVGGTRKDVERESSKVKIARRVIKSINPNARVSGHEANWQEVAGQLRRCDVIVGGLDSVRAKDEIDSFCRRFMIPYIDMGMDVFETSPGQFLISGQVVLTGHGQPCLRCLGIVTEEGLANEAARYGAAGGHPQVVWPNGLLASCAVGFVVQMLTPWSETRVASAFIEYDGNRHQLRGAEILRSKSDKPCPHHNDEDVGDPFFRLADFLKQGREPEVEESRVPSQVSMPSGSPSPAPASQTMRRGFFQRLRAFFNKSRKD